MVELRFFEIYRNSEYLLLLGQGVWVSFILTVSGAIAGLVLAIGLSDGALRAGPCSGMDLGDVHRVHTQHAP